VESQEGSDAIKHKGHIASRVPESDVGGDERVRQAQQPPAPEGSLCISVRSIICVCGVSTVANANVTNLCSFWCSVNGFS